MFYSVSTKVMMCLVFLYRFLRSVMAEIQGAELGRKIHLSNHPAVAF